eukprot:6264330-Karenia_brevis.AAC.1
MKAYGCKWNADILGFGLWVGASRGYVKGRLRAWGVDLVQFALSRHFTYAGHVARGSSGQICSALIGYRGHAFIRRQRELPWRRKDANCRKGGTQLPVYDELLDAFFLDRDVGVDWQQVASCIETWHLHETNFVCFARRNRPIVSYAIVPHYLVLPCYGVARNFYNDFCKARHRCAYCWKKKKKILGSSG